MAKFHLHFVGRILIAWVAVHLTVLSGCHLLQRRNIVVVQEYSTDQPVDYFVSPHFFRAPPGRIVLMIPKMRDNGFEVQTRFADAIQKSLSTSGIFEVILKTGYCDVSLDSIRDGTFDARKLLDITRQHNADGIMFCEVSSFSAYEPLQLGCALTFIDTRESIVTLHTSGVWDSAVENVHAKFLQQICRIHKCKQYAAGVYLKSPTEFMEFVARDLTEFLQSKLGPGINGDQDFDSYQFGY